MSETMQQLTELFRKQAVEFGTWLRRQREQTEMSQAEFAAFIGLPGREQLGSVEKGRKSVTRDRAIKIAEALSLPVREVLHRAGYLVGDEEIPSEIAAFPELTEKHKNLVAAQVAMLHKAQMEEAQNAH